MQLLVSWMVSMSVAAFLPQMKPHPKHREFRPFGSCVPRERRMERLVRLLRRE